MNPKIGVSQARRPFRSAGEGARLSRWSLSPTALGTRGPGGLQPRAPRVGAPASPPRLARSWSGNSHRPGRAGAEPLSRLGRGAPLPFRPEPEERPLRRPPLERRSPNSQQLTLPEAAAVLLAFLQKPQEAGDENLGQTRFLEDSLLNW
ncbi:PREDICTED: spexin [Bison bison bison]|uniref:Spexin n=1 Tax=Bison bison bison TaxID=43346 RepID=A0A6P3IRM3_BISBB|nr:PREDICTED: spexin [Bison bison bison]